MQYRVWFLWIKILGPNLFHVKNSCHWHLVLFCRCMALRIVDPSAGLLVVHVGRHHDTGRATSPSEIIAPLRNLYCLRQTNLIAPLSCWWISTPENIQPFRCHWHHSILNYSSPISFLRIAISSGFAHYQNIISIYEKIYIVLPQLEYAWIRHYCFEPLVYQVFPRLSESNAWCLFQTIKTPSREGAYNVWNVSKLGQLASLHTYSSPMSHRATIKSSTGAKVLSYWSFPSIWQM